MAAHPPGENHQWPRGYLTPSRASGAGNENPFSRRVPGRFFGRRFLALDHYDRRFAAELVSSGAGVAAPRGTFDCFPR